MMISVKGASHDDASFHCGPGGVIPDHLVPDFKDAIDSGEIVTAEEYIALCKHHPELPALILPVLVNETHLLEEMGAD